MIMLGWVLVAAAAEDESFAGREAQMAAAVLVKQTDLLRAEVVRLRAEVERLTLALAQARAQIDLANVGNDKSYVRPAAEQAESRHAPTPGDAGGWRISDVNPDLKLAVLDSGKSDGVKAGMMLFALRGAKPTARLRVVEVRERIAATVIEESFGEGSPAKGDRAVLMTEPK